MSSRGVEGSALAMDLAEASFDVVLCQQGFQFFPDKRAGLHEMSRVLVPRGRALLSVWRGESPYTLAMGEAVERHVGPEAAATLRQSRTVPDPDALQQLMIEAGFKDVQIRARTLTRRLPAVAEFVLRHLAATPVADAVAALGDGAREALARDVSEALQVYVTGDGVAYPEVTIVAMATR
jgi:SAM-dependent methyltransferase